jgi:hypothetical protein
LYPTIAAAARDARIVLRDPAYGAGRAQIVLRPVHLLDLERLITDAYGYPAAQARSAFAYSLVFGHDRARE